MTVRVNKPAFNLREKLSELERPIGLKGSELMKSETVQDARDLVSAGRKNIMINGALEINQRGFSSRVYTSASNNVYTVDRFAIDWSLNGQMTVTLEDDAPTGFNKSIKFTVDTASTDNLAQSEYNTLKYNVESRDTSHLAYGTPDAKPITLSFWVKANHPGKYSAGFRSYAVGQTRGNHQSYRINSPNTWEYKTLTFVGDTEYALPNDNSISLQLHMAVTNGDTIDDPTDDGYWNSGNQIGLLSESTMDDFNSTAGNTIQWTGFQLEVGRNATEFEHRSYGEEFALCQRYCQSFDGRIAIGNWNGATSATVVRYLSPPMRIAPSIYSYTAGRCLVEAVAWYNIGSVAIQSETRNTSVVFTLNSIANSGQSVNANAMWGNGASVVLQAEL